MRELWPTNIWMTPFQSIHPAVVSESLQNGRASYAQWEGLAVEGRGGYLYYLAPEGGSYSLKNDVPRRQSGHPLKNPLPQFNNLSGFLMVSSRLIFSVRSTFSCFKMSKLFQQVASSLEEESQLQEEGGKRRLTLLQRSEILKRVDAGASSF